MPPSPRSCSPAGPVDRSGLGGRMRSRPSRRPALPRPARHAGRRRYRRRTPAGSCFQDPVRQHLRSQPKLSEGDLLTRRRSDSYPLRPCLRLDTDHSHRASRHVGADVRTPGQQVTSLVVDKHGEVCKLHRLLGGRRRQHPQEPSDQLLDRGVRVELGAIVDRHGQLGVSLGEREREIEAGEDAVEVERPQRRIT